MIRIGMLPTTTMTTNGAMRDRRYTAFLAGKGALRFAHSRVPSKLVRPGVKRHRFFVNCEMWQSERRSDDGTNSWTRLFWVDSNHRPLDRSLLLSLARNDNQHAQHDEPSWEAKLFLEESISADGLYKSIV